MQVLISDSNVLIDLYVVNQLDSMFKLPFAFTVPDILFEEELKTNHSNLTDLGLNVMVLDSETIKYTFQLSEKYDKPGRIDLFALALAKNVGCPLLTGDMDLRKAAEEESVALYGTVWVIEQLVISEIITIADAYRLYDEMKEKKRRLPWEVAEARLIEMEER
jgi:predicted nucleic acid-binding protein